MSNGNNSTALPSKVELWPEEWRFLYEERAAIKEFSGNMSKFKAEMEAEKEIRALAEGEKQERLFR